VPVFDLTVIVALAPGHPGLEPVLGSLATSCVGLATEVLVIGDVSKPVAAPALNLTIRTIPSEEGTLIPMRWGEGIAAAQGPVVACLSTEFSVAESWARTLLPRIAGGTVGAASAIDLAPGASATTAAMYLLRFAHFLPWPDTAPKETSNIPGDGAMYLRSCILEHSDLLAEGFWEIEFHKRWLRAGKRLSLDRSPQLTFVGPATLENAAMLRYRHGVTYGSTMVLRHSHSRMRHILSAPILPLVLIARIAAEVRATGQGLATFLRALPPLLVLTSAWSLGEAIGAARARKRAR